MQIRQISQTNSLDILPLLVELERYYFKENAATQTQLQHYLTEKMFSEHSGVKVVAAVDGQQVLGFASYTVMFPAPNLSGQMYMKDLFVSSNARGRGVGVFIMKHLANLAIDIGCQRFDWTAENTNPSAGEFYKAIGASLLHEKEYYRFAGEELAAFAKSL